jgi:aldehyde:ferredoxin oxidoreductase
MLSAATGRSCSPDVFQETGERIWNLVRLFNLGRGINVADDTLPRRFVEEPLPDGPGKGHRISKQDMALMRQDYYRIRGWDENGVPLENTLKRLRINDVHPDQ